MQSEIAPHGGKLINTFVSGDAANALRERAMGMTKIHLADRRLSDLEMIGCGAFSPLDGFMKRNDYDNCVVNKRLSNGIPWTIPVTLAVTSDEAQNLNIDDEVALVDKFENILAVFQLEEIYKYDREREARLVYRTTDESHPGVKNLYRRGDIHLGGPHSGFERARRQDVSRISPDAGIDAARVRGAWLEEDRRFSNAQPDSPRARIHHQMRARNDGRLADSSVGRPVQGR
jgi:sulfate adenylyltransferase